MNITLLRSALERSSHRLVIRRRLPSPFTDVKIYASSEGGLRYLAPHLTNVDPSLLRLVSETVKPGSRVWDIGANLGLFAYAAAAAAGPRGHVLAVEPDTVLVGQLRRSATTNKGIAHVDVLPVAVSDSVSVASFHIARRNRSTSHLAGFGTTQTGGTRTSNLVPTVTLDWLADHFPLPDVIKIDVEEAELKVLSGASRVLDSLPVIICEVAGRNATDVYNLLSRRGYLVYDGDQGPAHRIIESTAKTTTLAIPGSRG